VLAGYRLSPKVKNPVYIEDAAAATAWAFNNIARHKGNPKKIYVSGHSAGGYLAAMLGVDGRWLAKHKISSSQIAGAMPIAGQMMTHSTIRAERGLKATTPFIDD
jgi:acetyl esterase/lipase